MKCPDCGLDENTPVIHCTRRHIVSWRATDVKGHKMWENSEGERSLDPFPHNDDVLKGIATYKQSIAPNPIYIRSTSITAFITGTVIGFGAGILITIQILT